MKRASYRDAIDWIVRNDDTADIGTDDDPMATVTMALVADLFEVPDERVRKDVLKALERRT